MTEIEVQEIWAFQAMQDDMHSANLKLTAYYGEHSYPEYGLEDRERLLIVRLPMPRVEVHVLFPTPGYMPDWVDLLTHRYKGRIQ